VKNFSLKKEFTRIEDFLQVFGSDINIARAFETHYSTPAKWRARGSVPKVFTLLMKYLPEEELKAMIKKSAPNGNRPSARGRPKAHWVFDGEKSTCSRCNFEDETRSPFCAACGCKMLTGVEMKVGGENENQ